MKAHLVIAVIALIHGTYATLLIKGPTEPILEGDMVTLECQYSDSDLNISQVHFEYFSKYMNSWRAISERSWCFYRMPVTRTENSLLLFIPHAGVYYEGPYRCVSDSDNVTAPDNSSLPLALKVHYMGALMLSREGYSSYLSTPQDLKVRRGDEVVLKCSASSSEEPKYSWYKEGSDWVLPSSTLTLRKMSEVDEGRYTCVAEHSVEALNKKRSISITVLPEDAPWYESSNGRLILMTSAAAASLVVFILSVTAFLCLRAKRVKTRKGPIDDRSQIKPIYKTSVDSLPSTCGDKQPLV
ncbi:leucine-rich repeats and immunoglobulin-like domains protein 2 [Salarias fasciatus]|uniref:Leucine-rich repeats and immunoglobulin-like domains protein 2 n=1 Tax=Salarias fasciatus TaxID=181472 RepID=A0A672FEU4_SALFA|nr:leucine-rich repeats and immunoglobulin-like domains protein 2 [Salarias fasciatus]